MLQDMDVHASDLPPPARCELPKVRLSEDDREREQRTSGKLGDLQLKYSFAETPHHHPNTAVALFSCARALGADLLIMLTGAA